MPMTEHPLAFILREACGIAATEIHDVVQGSVTVHLAGSGRGLTGRITWVSEDAQAFSLVRLTQDRHGWDLAETPQHIVSAHIERIYYNEAGAE